MVFGIIAFFFLAVGVVTVYLGETQESFYADKNKIGIAGDVCSGVGTVWLFIPFLVPANSWVVAIMIIIAFLFYAFTWRFYRKSSI